MLNEKIFFGRRTHTFTLQWHLTNACPNRCRHCYDRSQREIPTFRNAQYIISELLKFCASYNLKPRISLSGGDPFSHPQFFEILNLIARNCIPYSILGNPQKKKALEKLVSIQRPIYYQVSLEGDEAYNDTIRGENHFSKTMNFLHLAQEMGISTHVMLTLSSENLSQVIPLAKKLQGIAMRFSFNRISRAGEAKNFPMPEKNAFIDLLVEYARESKYYSVFSFKDNLFNILQFKFKRKLLGGCTGFGCGAAFNFVALLPDGEVHACRKFPSCIGNIYKQSFSKIYFSDIALQYRMRPVKCRKCPIQKSCGGCMASTWSAGLNPHIERDPYCFIDDKSIISSVKILNTYSQIIELT
ncbi:MAG: thio(seleno)oxazole modification radical SAM maturase SbtM [Spirochaetes bacterium]|nr:thio(seleno)oxazole modification radical SAM maturase SbtM [Spirochaetota bacterium]